MHRKIENGVFEFVRFCRKCNFEQNLKSLKKKRQVFLKTQILKEFAFYSMKINNFL